VSKQKFTKEQAVDFLMDYQHPETVDITMFFEFNQEHGKEPYYTKKDKIEDILRLNCPIGA